MGIWEQVSQNLTEAMKARQQSRVEALRLIRAEGLKKQKEKSGVKMDDELLLQILKSMAKQRHESIEIFEKAGREDLVEKEKAQLEVIDSYLPAPADEAVIDQIIDEAITGVGASSLKDMGKVMGQVMKRLKEIEGLVDGSLVNAKVKAKLSN